MQSPSEFLDDAAGKDLTTLAKQGVGGWLLALSAAVISGTEAVVNLLIFPLEALADVGAQSVSAFILEPLGIIEAGSAASASGAAEFGLFGLPVGTAVVLFTLFMITLYLARDRTGNLIPTLPYDFPTPFFEDPEEDEVED